MPKYMFQGSYSQDSWKSLVSNPENREDATRKLFEGAGGRLEAYYWAFGEDDWVAIGELPDDEAAGSVSIAASSSGAVTAHTTKLITMDEAQSMLRKAGKLQSAYHRPGAARAGV
jgi:uncharacterized protein with GYD domain